MRNVIDCHDPTRPQAKPSTFLGRLMGTIHDRESSQYEKVIVMQIKIFIKGASESRWFT